MTTILSADRPQTDPSCDLFGYAPYARNLAKAICNHHESDPLVLGLYGSWGSGKSTLLKFICHNLKEQPEENRPIVIEFNPWWFSGQENLAKAFLGQLQAVLPKKYKAFKKLGELLGSFSESIGEVIDITGLNGSGGNILKSLLKTIFKRPPRDVPTLKEEICAILRQSRKHILIMLDDIDRLEAEEIRQLFTVIKALADFPNVIYLLAFDQSVVVKAIEKHGNMPGQEYLEKIIQVPFVVPQVDKTSLLNALNIRLDEILRDTPPSLFDPSHWHTLFYHGIDQFFTVPRDIVRFCNTLSITYPAVCGEVNAADFIVIEALRIFLPSLYIYIRENQNDFIASLPYKKLPEKDLQAIVEKNVPENFHKDMERILKNLFPYTHTLSEHSYARRALRICIAEIFPCYFRFSPSLETIRRAEIMQWLDKAEDSDAFGAVLLQAKKEDGSRLRMLLDRLRDHIQEDIPENNISTVLCTMLDIGDELLEAPNEAPDPLLRVNNSTLIQRNVDKLIKRLPFEQRLSTFKNIISIGNAIFVQGTLLHNIETAIAKEREVLISQSDLPQLKALWLEKIDDRIKEGRLLPHQYLSHVLLIWLHWETDKEKVKNWCSESTDTDAGMFSFIEKFIFTMRMSTTEERFINPKYMQKYINIVNIENRIHTLQTEGNIPPKYEEIASLYLQGMTLWREGKNPEDVF